MSLGNAQDVALERAYSAYRSIAKGTLALPTDPSAYDQKLTAYMRAVAWRLLRNHKRAGDMFMPHDREPGTELLVSRTYHVEPALVNRATP
ncbi:hypothetical protein WMF20_30365 [Sorangium sp. So ce834]|uniref:hypothetical protein n=1 Tax=Sorangium sp. So ce834 TaxID=3133321 RepID=UPI003F5FD234